MQMGIVFLVVVIAGPVWIWRGGRHDPMRNLLLRADGSWRKHAKLGVRLFWLLGAICTLVVISRHAPNSYTVPSATPRNRVIIG
jgi:hypothetical protein